MRIISLNLNGIRAAARKGFFTWLEKQNADVVCLQEIKAQEEQIAEALFRPEGYHTFYFPAQQKGYSGVALYTRAQPDRIIKGLGWAHADDEGRYLQADFGKLSIASLYMPSGSSGEERQQIKFDFMDRYLPTLQRNLDSKREFIICGDWNIVHQEIDIKNFRSNQKNSGCLPEERAWLDQLFTKVGYVDAFRIINQEKDQYTWWSNRGRAWENNVGWRIDYQVISPALAPTVKKEHIYKTERFSDHAPLIMDYDLQLQDF